MFDGFILPENGTGHDVTMPANWPDTARGIDNLAELKVVQLVLFMTYGRGYFDMVVPISIDDFVTWTGLSEQSVRTGIKKAIEHGYIEQEIERYIEDGKARSIHYYGLKFYQAQDLDSDVEQAQDLGQNTEFSFSDEPACEAIADENQEFSISSSNEFERDTHSNNSGNIHRIQEDTNDLPPCKGLLLSGSDNATLCSRMESLSKALGDHGHIASNIGQARRILASYQARGGNFEAFLLLMYEARDLARRKTKIRRKNRMPYFFKCLRTACDSVELAAA